MIWGQLIMTAVSFLVTSLLSPKPQIENARASKLSDAQFPQSSEGSPLALVLGKVRLKAPNTLWYGDFEAVPIIKKIKTGLFSSKSQVVGYKYYVGFNLGLCLGPEVELLKIWIEKNLVWEGTIGPAESTAIIDKPSLFGGDELGSGGFTGTLRFYGGSFTQPVNAYLDGVQPGDTPATVGQAHIVFEKAYIGNQANLKPVSFEVTRYTDGLGLATEQRFIGEDLNPMEVLYQVLTLDWGGLGADTNDIDVASFVEAAQTLKDEENGLSLLVTSVNEGQSIVEEILRQVDGVLFQDPTTGKIKMQLIRFDYDPLALPEFDESDIVSVRGFSSTSWSQTINQIRVSYTNRDNKYEKGAAIVQDLANINMQGKIRSSSLSFPNCYTADLATKLANRELTQLSVPLFKATLELNRRAGTLRPGDAFVLTWPDYHIDSVIMRVQRFNLGELIKGRVVVECIQDRFAVDKVVFAAPDASQFVPINREALEVVDTLAQESPYWYVNQQDEIIPTAVASRGYVMAMAKSPSTVMQGYKASVSDDNFDTIITGVDHLPFTNTAELSGVIADNEGFTNGVLTSINIEGLSRGLQLSNATLAEMRSGANLFWLNGELLGFLSVTDNGGGSFTLGTVYRSLLDTTPGAHVAADVIYFMDSADPLVLTDFATDGVTIKNKYQSFTDLDEYLFSAAAEVNIVTNRRYERPLPPDNITVEGSRVLPISVQDNTSITVAWAKRDRLADLIAIETGATEIPEAGTTYTIEVKSGVTVIVSSTGNTGTSAAIALPVGNLGAATIEVKAVKGGLDSYNVASVPITIID